MTLSDIFDIAADAYEEGRVDRRNAILAELAPEVRAWYWVIGPERGRPRPTIQVPEHASWSFTRLAFPMIRQTFSTLIANELVSVQPMTAPAGMLFYMDYRYDSEKKSED